MTNLEKKAREKAEKIIEATKPRLGDLYGEYVRYVSSALLEFAREAVREELKGVTCEVCYREGLLMAAEIAKKLDCLCMECLCDREIEKQIKAEAEKGSGK